MSGKRKTVMILILILLALLSAAAVYIAVTGTEAELEAFASEDGTHLYRVEEYGKDRHRILKIDRDSDRVLWKTGVPLEYTLNHRADYPALFFDEKNVYYYIHEGFLLTETAGDTVRTGMASHFFLAAFDKATGETVFSLRVPDPDRILTANRKVPYVNLKDKVILINPILTEAEDRTMFTVVDKKSGTIEAQEALSCEEILARPLGTGSSRSGYFSLWSPGLAYIFNKDEISDFRELKTGNTFGWQDEENYCYFNRNSELIRHNLKAGTEEVMWDFDGALPRDIYRYKNTLIGYEKDLITDMDSGSVTPLRQFVAYDFSTGKRMWEYILPEGYGFNIFANSQRDINPETAVYHDIPFPTLPLVVSSEEEGRNESKIIVIDSENGREVRESAPLPQTDLSPSNVFRTSSFYLVVLEKHLVRIDPETGKADKVIRIFRESEEGAAELFPDTAILTKNIAGDRLFIPRGNRVLRVDLKNGTIDTIGKGKETFRLELTEQ